MEEWGRESKKKKYNKKYILFLVDNRTLFCYTEYRKF